MILLSNFRTAADDPRAISIAAITPRGYTGAVRKDLAPKAETMRAFKKGEITMAEYLYEYVDTIYTFDLEELAKELDGHVLLCYCSKNDLCHRLVLGHYLMVETGIEIFEIGGFGNLVQKDIKLLKPPVEINVTDEAVKSKGLTDIKAGDDIVGRWRELKKRNLLDLYSNIA